MGATTNEIPRIREAGDHPARRAVASSGQAHAGQARHSARDFQSWYDRFLTGGVDALEDRKPQPKRVWNRIPDEVRQKVIDLALDEPELSPRELAVTFTDIPAFGYKNHAAIDRHHGFIRGWNVTSAAAWDGAQLRNFLDRSNTGSTVWADTAYRSKANEARLERHGFISDIHSKKPKGRPLGEATSCARVRRPRIRSCIEHVFARQKAQMNHVVRTIGMKRARVKIGMSNLAYNMLRLVWHEGQRAPA